VRDLRHADVGIGEHRLGGLDVVVRQSFGGRPPVRPARPRGGEARLGTLPDQAAFEFRQLAKNVLASRSWPPVREDWGLFRGLSIRVETPAGIAGRGRWRWEAGRGEDGRDGVRRPLAGRGNGCMESLNQSMDGRTYLK